MRTKAGHITLALLLLPSCNMLQRNDFKLTNATDREVKDIQVRFADVVVKRPSLGPGETLALHPSPDRDGGISVSYVQSGKSFDHKLGYAAPPISMTCEFTLVGADLRGDCTQN